MAQIYSSSAPLIAFFETGDVPTADNFSSLIQSFAVYGGTLPLFSGSSTSTGSFAHLLFNQVGSNLLPDQDNLRDIGSTTLEWKDLHLDGTANIDLGLIDSASIGKISSSLIPDANDIYDLGTEALQWKNIFVNGMAHIDSASISNISSSILPFTDNTYDLGSSTKEWKDIYIDGVAYIDTIGETVNITTASLGKG